MNTIQSFFYYQIVFLLFHCIPTNILSMEVSIQYYGKLPVFTQNLFTQNFPFFITHRKQQTYAAKRKNEKALHNAAIHNNEQEVYKLIASGVNIDAPASNTLNTALHYACIYNHLNIVKILTNKGANTNIQNHMGNTSLHCAAYLGHLKIGQLLIDKQASINIINNKKENPLHFAVLSFITHAANEESTYKPIEFIKLLVNNNADTTIRNNKKNTAFQAKDNQGNTALHIAAFNGNIEMAQIIMNVDKYNNINIKNNDGETPLYLATLSLITSKKNESLKKEQLIQLIELLLNKGARTSIKNCKNFRPDNGIAIIVADTPQNEQDIQQMEIIKNQCISEELDYRPIASNMPSMPTSDTISTKDERAFINHAHALLLCAQLENLALSEISLPLKQSII